MAQARKLETTGSPFGTFAFRIIIDSKESGPDRVIARKSAIGQRPVRRGRNRLGSFGPAGPA